MKKFVLKMAATVLCMTAAASAGAQMTQVPDRMFINDFSIKPGDSQIVDVWFENTKPWTMLEAHIFLPDGLKFAKMEKGEIDSEKYVFDAIDDVVALSLNFYDPTITCGEWAEKFKDSERTEYPSANLQYLVKDDNHLVILLTCNNFRYGIMGDGTYAMFQVKVQSAKDFTGGEISVCPDGVKYVSYDENTLKQGEPSAADIDTYGQPYYAHVTLPPVGIEDVKAAAAADSPIFDLQGRVVTGTPAPGIYVKQGKKVVVE